ncbi:MAG: carbohydrate ABC transporter permease [Ruminococcaceae bacterium]|nr:carbohydrate ABC transporter permease [Oscillospiraceae bacterium]
MVGKSSLSRKIFVFFNTIFMLLMITVSLYPLWYVFCASFSNAAKYMAHRGLLLWPIEWTWAAYEHAFEHPLILPSYLNTIFVVVVGTCLSILFSTIAAYFLSRKNVPFKRPIALLMTFTMYFSGGLVPFYFTIKTLNMDNSLWVLIIPSMLTMYNILVMRGGFDGIPDSLEDAANIDGAGHITTLFRIMFPLVLPTIAVVTLYYGVTYWNAWFNASIFIDDRKKYPLQLVLRQILISGNTNDMTLAADAGSKLALQETIKHAVSVIATVPILCLYPFLQRYFVKGVMVGAVKG